MQDVRRSIQAEPLYKLIERAKQRGREKAKEELVAAGKEVLETTGMSRRRRGSVNSEVQ